MNEASGNNTESKSQRNGESGYGSGNRSWFQISLRFLLLVTTAVVLLTIWATGHYKASRAESSAIELLSQQAAKNYLVQRGDIRFQDVNSLVRPTYSYQYDRAGNFLPDATPSTPAWLHGLLGPLFLDRVVTLEIDTSYEYDSGDGVWCVEYKNLDATSLDCISKFQHLKKLSLITGLDSINDYGALTSLPKLESFEVVSPETGFPLSSIKDISTLKELGVNGVILPTDKEHTFRLEKLSVRYSWSEGPELEEFLNHFGDLSGLESLELNYFPLLSSIKTKSGLESLKELNLESCYALESLDGLEDSPLESVRINSSSKLKDISAISGSTSLKRLEVSQSFYSTTDPLHCGERRISFPALEEAVFKTPVGSIEFLAQSQNLKTLWLDDQTITNVDALAQLPDLRELHLSCPNVEAIGISLDQLESFFCYFRRLHIADFLTTDENNLKRFSLECSRQKEGDGLSELRCLRFARKLERLDINNCGIENMEFVAGLDNLKHVQLMKNNRLVSIDGLKSTTDSLESLRLISNRNLFSFDVLNQPLPRMKKLQISNTAYDGTLTDLLINVQFNIQGNLNRFDQLDVPNQKKIGKPRYDYWSFPGK